TVALIWPPDPHLRPNAEPSLTEVVQALQSAKRGEAPALIENWLNALEPQGRWALLKLMTGGLRVGLSARLAKTAAAMIRPATAPEAASSDHPAVDRRLDTVDVSDIEEVWHGLEPPYADLFAWLEGRAERPSSEAPGRFRPVMLAVALDEETDPQKLDPQDYAAEWKWDGIRVQAVVEQGVRKLWSRSGDEISATFPDVMSALDFEGALDGELVVLRGEAVAPFSDLQQRLNRKTVDTKLIQAFPAAIVAYDLLALDGQDLRGLDLRRRREMLEAV
ncbi:hypothetical protein LTR94_028937, partial [Friedmanniomyces endolithicus]